MTAGLVVLAFSFIGGMLGAWVIARPSEPNPKRVVGICQSVVSFPNVGCFIEITAVRADGSLSRMHARPMALDRRAPINTVVDFDPERKTWEQR